MLAGYMQDRPEYTPMSEWTFRPGMLLPAHRLTLELDEYYARTYGIGFYA